LNDFNTFPSFCEGADSKVVGELLGRLEEIWSPELAADHDKGCEEEGAFRPDVGGSVESRVKEIDEWVETKEKEIEKHFRVLFGQKPRGNGIEWPGGRTRYDSGDGIGMRGGPRRKSLLGVEDGPEERVALVLALDELGGIERFLIFIAILILLVGVNINIVVVSGSVGLGGVGVAVLIGRDADRRKAIRDVVRGRRGRDVGRVDGGRWRRRRRSEDWVVLVDWDVGVDVVWRICRGGRGFFGLGF